MVPITTTWTDPERSRRIVGIILYILGMVVGASLLVGITSFSVLNSEHIQLELSSMVTGALFALPMMVVYLWVPWILDRYDPEPWWALAMTLAWGAVAACGFSATVNTIANWVGTAVSGEHAGEILRNCVSAPLTEELTKGLAIFFMFYFMRREFDGVVDGVIYATFAALGFAAVENILYYGEAVRADMVDGQQNLFAGTFIVRGILAPWCHPLYTSMTGIGFGISRETNNALFKWLAPLGGYLIAVFLHSAWNTAALVSNALVFLMLPIWLLFVAAFGLLVISLVARKGKIIQEYLQDEVMMGVMTPWEVALVGSPVASFRATFSYGGSTGRRFVAAASRLALSKWHTGRAASGAKMTVSAGMVLPLRQEIGRLRTQISRVLGRPVQEPRVAVPGGGEATVTQDSLRTRPSPEPNGR